MDFQISRESPSLYLVKPLTRPARTFLTSRVSPGDWSTAGYALVGVSDVFTLVDDIFDEGWEVTG